MSMSNTEKTVKDIHRNARRRLSTEKKFRVLPPYNWAGV